uniref:Uncharacterized protein n=1 Tax=Cacopsylla melanoneura TaxID=428564 RepID=A0A8D8UU91_9HEMI
MVMSSVLGGSNLRGGGKLEGGNSLLDKSEEGGGRGISVFADVSCTVVDRTEVLSTALLGVLGASLVCIPLLGDSALSTVLGASLVCKTKKMPLKISFSDHFDF